jgi:hypothetical protein
MIGKYFNLKTNHLNSISNFMVMIQNSIFTKKKGLYCDHIYINYLYLFTIPFVAIIC